MAPTEPLVSKLEGFSAVMPDTPVPGGKNSGSTPGWKEKGNEITVGRTPPSHPAAGHQENRQPPRPSLITSAIHSCPLPLLRAKNNNVQAKDPSNATISTLPTGPSIAQRRSTTQATSQVVAPPAAVFYQHQPEPSPTLSDYPSSLPINIPPRQEKISRPSTPLTGRFDHGAHFPPSFGKTPKKPQISQSLRPTYLNSAAVDRAGSRMSPPRTSRTMRPDQTSPLYTPSSPLSPTTANAPSSSQRRPDPYLHMPSLPRFHPAVYQSPNSSNLNSPSRNRTPTSLTRPPRSPQLHHRQFSDAKQRVHTHQRELITNATRAAANINISPVRRETPKAPALAPCGSPGPATPLMLEEPGDYLTVGAGGQFGEGSPRELVDKLIQHENERSNGLHSGPGSPAMSPAGGRG